MPKVRQSPGPCRYPVWEEDEKVLYRRVGCGSQKGNRLRLYRVDQRDDRAAFGRLSRVREKARSLYDLCRQKNEKVQYQRLGSRETDGNRLPLRPVVVVSFRRY